MVLSKKELVRALILSPLYLSLKLKDRAILLKSMAIPPRQRPVGSSTAATEGAQT